MTQIDMMFLLSQRDRCLRLASSCTSPDIIAQLQRVAAEYSERIRQEKPPVEVRLAD